MLWYCPAKPGKLWVNWHGPYIVAKEVSPVKYIIKDASSGEERPASVQHLVPFYGETVITDDATDTDVTMVDETDPLA